MKYKGIKPPAPRSKDITFPREEGDIVFKLEPVLNYEKRFDNLYPSPQPPVVTTFDHDNGGRATKTTAPEDESYLAALTERQKTLPMWLIYESIKGNDDVDFENVTDDPATWIHIEDELLEFLVMGEMALLIEEVQMVNLPNKFVIEDTIKSFAQARRLEESNRSSRNTGQSGTESGEPVSD